MRYVVVLLLIVLMIQCRQKESPSDPDSGIYQPTPYILQVPQGFPQPYISSDNPLTNEGVDLGKRLYSDAILSSNGLSCSSCHYRSKSFSTPYYITPDGDKISIPPHVNLVFNPDYNWNGSVTKLETLPMGDFEPQFFNTNADTLFYRLSHHSLYPELFYKAFGITNFYTLSYEELKMTICKALTQYLRTLISADSKLDRYQLKGGTLTQQERDGMDVFFSERGDCFHCHGYPLFTDNLYHNNGVDDQFIGQNAGRNLITHAASDLGMFSTPTLRNIELTAPYMHDGRFNTLEEVVEFYNSGVKFSRTIDPIMTKPGKESGLQLTAYEKSSLVAFLKTLTDTSFISAK